MLLKKRSLLRSLLLTTKKFLLMFLRKKILIKKIKYIIFLRRCKFPPEISESFFEFFVSRSIKKFPKVDFFYLSSLGRKVQGSVFGNMRKAFFWESIILFLIFRLKSLFSRNIRNFLGFPFWDFSFLKILIFEVKSSISRNIESFFQGEFLIFFFRAREQKCARCIQNVLLILSI